MYNSVYSVYYYVYVISSNCAFVGADRICLCVC